MLPRYRAQHSCLLNKFIVLTSGDRCLATWLETLDLVCSVDRLSRACATRPPYGVTKIADCAFEPSERFPFADDTPQSSWQFTLARVEMFIESWAVPDTKER